MLPTIQQQIEFREKILKLQDMLVEKVENGEIESCLPKCTLTHRFTPISGVYGCCTYAREIFLPKGTIVIGKIHKHEHLNFIMKGKVSVATEFGKKYFEAPCTFVSEPGLKRAVYAEEDTIWTTVHLTKYNTEEALALIEKEVIAETYEEIGMISSTQASLLLEDK